MVDLVEKAKLHFLETFESSDPNVRLYDELPRHVAILEKWVKHLLKSHPEADEDILLSSVWLHDIGQLVGEREEDHAVRSEREVLRFLPTLNIPEDLVRKIAHCVRAHRCKDVQPNSIEAKLLAAADSVSHFTDIVYIDMANKLGKEEPLAKLERDYRDIGLLPELKSEIAPLYKSWKSLLSNYPAWFLSE
ncbi:HD domain-containing protein [Patescibacteria group bacterium]|nr:HD domain-containing protein [Patescibacteria group bacterium]